MVADTADTGDAGISRRRLLTYLAATPTLSVAVRVADSIVGPDRAEAAEATSAASAAPAQVAEFVDFSDVLTLAAAPTQHLLVVEITTANRVVVRVPRAEVGQGITTAMAVLAAEELDARLADVDVVLEDARPELLFNQLTGGSNSVHALYLPMRVAAAGARARLVTAAAQRWGVAAGSLRTNDTTVIAPDGRTATYGELSIAAAQVLLPAVLPVPKDADDFELIGRPTTRIDARDIVTGGAKYTQDLAVPGALPCVVARPPTIRGTVATVDDVAARAIPGVVAVTSIPTGVAVVAQTFDQALKARDALRITWNPGPSVNLSDADIRSRLAGKLAPFAAPPLGAFTVDRTFDFAFVPHAPMEVLNCVADVRADRAEIWFSCKSPIVAAQTVALQLGLPVDKVKVHVIRGGGSFGRRLFFDPAIEAAQISRAVGRPVRLLWTRADDMHHGRMRPASHHRARATHLLGSVLSYEHRMASVTLDGGHGLGEIISAVAGDTLGAVGQAMFHLSQKDPYAFGIQNRLLTEVDLAFPTASWRSVFSGQVRTVDEIMVDEIARTLGRDPVSFRRAKLQDARTRAVLDKVASAGQWGRSMAPRTAQGVAIHEEYKSVVAYLVEIDCRDAANPRVTKAVAAADVGRAVNPRGLEAQLQGVLIDGLSVTLQAGFHIDRGAVRESSYTDYRFGRMRHSPMQMEVHVMPPTGEPGGAGELGLPAAAAAVANAYARATGTLPRRFPIAG
jgi:isoquinoline 1-oxidoreductase beta subunit